MNISIEIKAPELVEAINNLAAALSGSNIAPAAPKKEADKPKPKKEEPAKQEAPVFETDSYFYHPESDAYTLFKKGEVIPVGEMEFEHCIQISKAEYEKGIAKQQEPAEENKPTVKLETVRAKLASLSQSGKQAQVKELITSFGAKKLTDVPADKYADLLAAAEEIA